MEHAKSYNVCNIKDFASVSFQEEDVQDRALKD